MNTELADPTTHRPAKGKAQRTFDRLARATLDEINEKGGFTAEEVAARASSSPATFFNYFPTKEDAVAASFSIALDELIAVTEGGLRIEQLLDEGLAQVSTDFTNRCIAYFREHALIFRLALTRLPTNKSIRNDFRNRQSAALAHYRRFIDLGQKSGLIRPGDPRVMADVLLVMTQGLNNPPSSRAMTRRSKQNSPKRFIAI